MFSFLMLAYEARRFIKLIKSRSSEDELFSTVHKFLEASEKKLLRVLYDAGIHPQKPEWLESEEEDGDCKFGLVLL